jgi:nucleolin
MVLLRRLRSSMIIADSAKGKIHNSHPITPRYVTSLTKYDRFGYVEFESVDAAEKAIDSLNQQPFQGRRLAVQFHRPREPLNKRRFEDGPQRVNPPSKTLFIGNMSFDMSDKDLNDLFREVKNVVDVRVAIDRRTGQPRGFAHCDLLDVESATKAKEVLSGKDVHGRKLRVDFSQSSADRAPRERIER